MQKLGMKGGTLGFRTSTRMCTVAFVALLAAFAGRTAVAQGDGGPLYGSIMDVLSDSTQSLGGFKQLAEATGLNATLANGSFVGTGFIPTDAALEAFAVAAGIGNGISGLAQLDPRALLAFLQFHILTNSLPSSAFPNFANPLTGGHVSATLLSAQYMVPSWNTRMACAAVNASDPQTAYMVKGSDGTNATVIVTDITVNNGTSYVHIIDAAIGYWYPDLRTAAYTFNFDYFYEGLVQASKIKPALMPNNETRMYFPPTNDMVSSFSQSTFISLRNISLSSATSDIMAAVDIIANHVTQVYDIPNGNSSTTMKTFSSAAGNSVTLKINVFPAPALESQVNKYGADTFIVAFASASIIESGYARVAVGGIVPTSYFYLSGQVLMPVYSNIWQYLTSSQLPSSVSYKNMTGLLSAAENSFIAQLQSPQTQGTFLAPLDSGVSAFLAAYNSPNLTQALGSSYLGTVVRVHLLSSALMKSNFTNNSTLATSSLVNQLTCFLNVVSPGSVTFFAGQTNATISSAAVDVPILYGRSYVQAINYVLVPSGVALPGAAGSAVPSLLLLAVAGLVGRWVAHLA